MAIYVFRCNGCGAVLETAVHDEFRGMLCECTDGVFRRAYSLEGVGFAVAGLKQEREEGGKGAIRDLFLPTAAEEATPEDPDGSKFIKEWNERHDPAPGNNKPMRPERPLHSKEVF